MPWEQEAGGSIRSGARASWLPLVTAATPADAAAGLEAEWVVLGCPGDKVLPLPLLCGLS